MYLADLAEVVVHVQRLLEGDLAGQHVPLEHVVGAAGGWSVAPVVSQGEGGHLGGGDVEVGFGWQGGGWRC